MRASFILLGPLLARFGRVIISNPGGDRIGRRPVNLHVDAMRALGAEIDYRDGYYFAQAPGRLHGGEIVFPQVTVMGTENAMLAATLADGPHDDPPGGAGARGRRPHRLPAQDGRRRQADEPGHDRGPRQAAPARREPHGRLGPDRDRHVPRRRGGDRRQAHARERPLRARRGPARAARARRGPRGLRHPLDRDRRDRAAARRPAALRHRDRAVPGPRDRPPAAGVRAADPGRAARRASTRRSSRTASSGWPSCASSAPTSTSPTPTTRRSPGRRASTAPRRRSATCAPAPR